MVAGLIGWLLLAGLLRHTSANPLEYHEAEGSPLAVVSELGQRLASRSRLQEPGDSHRLGLSSRLDSGDPRLGLASRLDPGDPKLGLPSPQEIDTIKKVAQILVMLGEQVIPTIIGDIVPPRAPTGGLAVAPPEEQNDPVNDN